MPRKRRTVLSDACNRSASRRSAGPLDPRDRSYRRGLAALPSASFVVRRPIIPQPAQRPYLVVKDAEGAFRITVRTTRLNSQRYPIVTSTLLEGGFPTMKSAREHLRETYNAQTGDIATK